MKKIYYVTSNPGKAEILLSYYDPRITIFKWNGTGFDIQFDRTWPQGEPVIEGIDVGDTDDDGLNEVAVGTGKTYILEWDGNTYIEEAVLPTFGELAVVAVGDMDNDGINEINAGSVMIEHGEEYMSWIYKYGGRGNEINQPSSPISMGTGRLRVAVKSMSGEDLGGGSVGAWNQDTLVWYDIQPENENWGSYYRSDLSGGEHLLRAVVEGYEIQETTITIVEGEETTYTFNLPEATSRQVNEESNSVTLQSTLLKLRTFLQQRFANSHLLHIFEKFYKIRFPDTNW